jgi:hypothetical protein
MCIRSVSTNRRKLKVAFVDGRELTVPLAWFPRLVHGTQAERDKGWLIGQGHGIHWPELDEDISAEGLLAGHPSGECQSSLERWMKKRSDRSALTKNKVAGLMSRDGK